MGASAFEEEVRNLSKWCASVAMEWVQSASSVFFGGSTNAVIFTWAVLHVLRTWQKNVFWMFSGEVGGKQGQRGFAGKLLGVVHCSFFRILRSKWTLWWMSGW